MKENMKIVYRTDLYNGDPVVNFEEDGKVAGFIVMMQEPQYRSLRLSCLEDIAVFLDDEEFHMNDCMKLETSTGMKDPADMPTMAFDRWDFAQTAKIYVYKEGGISDGKHHLEALVLVRSAQDNTLGSFGSGAYEGIQLDIEMKEGKSVC